MQHGTGIMLVSQASLTRGKSAAYFLAIGAAEIKRAGSQDYDYD